MDEDELTEGEKFVCKLLSKLAGVSVAHMTEGLVAEGLTEAAAKDVFEFVAKDVKKEDSVVKVTVIAAAAAPVVSVAYAAASPVLVPLAILDTIVNGEPETDDPDRWSVGDHRFDIGYGGPTF